ncbi:hypothetical protein CBR_g66640 [Chara braunii]|uniref:Uncharacterized protein n=1 Tax=Chara braunii TaxID=69332 RepID=A0A388JPX8_CHABU|nr:hypothetical protein CBR_g66640 [Chara braunii]|eukprot:GBG59837.1 hypothetical protein CBR_g66640 [Chara braunii]
MGEVVTTVVTVTEKIEKGGGRSESGILEETREKMRRGNEGESQGEGGVDVPEMVGRNVLLTEETTLARGKALSTVSSKEEDNGPHARESETLLASHAGHSSSNAQKAGEFSGELLSCMESGASESSDYVSSLLMVEGTLQMAVSEAFETTLQELRQAAADSEGEHLGLQARLMKRQNEAEELKEEKERMMSDLKESTEAKVEMAAALMESARLAEEDARQAQSELDGRIREMEEEFDNKIMTVRSAGSGEKEDSEKVQEFERTLGKLKKKLQRMERRREEVERDVKEQMMKTLENRLRSLDESDDRANNEDGLCRVLVDDYIHHQLVECVSGDCGGTIQPVQRPTQSEDYVSRQVVERDSQDKIQAPLVTKDQVDHQVLESDSKDTTRPPVLPEACVHHHQAVESTGGGMIPTPMLWEDYVHRQVVENAWKNTIEHNLIGGWRLRALSGLKNLLTSLRKFSTSRVHVHITISGSGPSADAVQKSETQLQ